MIHFFARERGLIRNFADSWAAELRPHLQTRSYHQLALRRTLPEGACVFTDFDRLHHWQLALARKFSASLQAESGRRRILNDPRRWLGRFDLLRTLHARGLNDFRAYRLDEAGGPLKFPVFLRSEIDHRGPITGLLQSRDDIARALRRLSWRNRFRRKHLMIVEYCDCGDGRGLFRKFSAQNVNGTLIPRHVLFSRDWIAKSPDHVTDASVEEERAFIEGFPHRDQLAAIFKLAGVDYGRVDYGMKEGRVQVWEINTNPIVVPAPKKLDPRRLSLQAASAARIKEALLALAHG